MIKRLKNKYFAVLAVVLLVRLFSHAFGPMDDFPRVQQTSVSPDGLWKIEIVKQKASFCPFAETLVSMRVTDVRAQRVSDIQVFRMGSWKTDYRKYAVRFEPDVIILNDFWVIHKDKLDLEMCPLLECLKESKE